MADPIGISGCFIWLKSSTLSLSNGSSVTFWSDGSNSGNSVTYPSASSTIYFPTYYSGVINGWPAVFFDGVQNGLTTKTNNASLNLSPSSVTLFTVYSTSVLTEQTLHSCDNNLDKNSAFGLSVNGDVTTHPSGWGFWYGKGGGGINNGAFQVQAGTGVGGSPVASTGQFYLRTDRFNSQGVFEFGQYGVPLSTGTATTRSSTSNTYNVGYDNTFGHFFNGYIAEIVGYNTKLSDSDTASVNNYLMNKYFPAAPVIPLTGPASLSGLIAWYKASSIGLTQGGAPVTYWRDDSGSGNNCTAPLPLSGLWIFPTYQPNQINGWPTVRFTNSLYYSYLQTDILSSYLQISSGNMSAFCVFNTVDGNTQQSIYNVGDTSTKNTFNIGINNNPGGFYFDYGINGVNTLSASSTTFGTNMLTAGQFMIRHDRFRSTDGEFLFGRYGADVASGTASTLNFSSTKPTLTIAYDAAEGTAFYGDIAEIILYNRRLSEGEVEFVNTYLLQKYLPGNVGVAPLFIYGDSPSGIYKDFPLYTMAGASGITAGVSLYTGSSVLSFSGVTAYMSGVGFSSLGTTLYTPGSYQAFPPMTLFIDGGGFSSSGTPLYISSSQFNTNTTTLYMSGSPVTNLVDGTASLYLLNIPTPSTTGSVPLFLSNNMSVAGSGNSLYASIPLYLEAGAWFASLPLFVDAGAGPKSPASETMPLYLYNPSSTGFLQGTVTLFVNNQVQVVDSHKKLYTLGSGKLKGGLPIQGNVNLTISGA